MPEEAAIAGVEGKEAEARGDINGCVAGGDMDVGEEMCRAAPLPID